MRTCRIDSQLSQVASAGFGGSGGNDGFVSGGSGSSFANPLGKYLREVPDPDPNSIYNQCFYASETEGQPEVMRLCEKIRGCCSEDCCPLDYQRYGHPLPLPPPISLKSVSPLPISTTTGKVEELVYTGNLFDLPATTHLPQISLHYSSLSHLSPLPFYLLPHTALCSLWPPLTRWCVRFEPLLMVPLLRPKGRCGLSLS